MSQNSSSYFLGDAKNDTFQRVYGMSYPDSKQLTEYKKYLEEAAKRDHRRIGKDQELFLFHDLSPGSAFFLPMGMRIYNTLIDYMKVNRPTYSGWDGALTIRVNTDNEVSRKVSPAVIETRTPLTCSRNTKHFQLEIVADFRSLGKLCRRHVPAQSGGRYLCSQADELSRTRLDV